MALSTSAGPPFRDRSLVTLAVAVAGSLLLHAALIALPRWQPRSAPDFAPLTVTLSASSVVVPPAPPPDPAPAAAPERERARPSRPPDATPESTRKLRRDPEPPRPRSREALPPPLVPAPPPEPPRTAPEPMPPGDLQVVYERLAKDDRLYPEEAIRRGLAGEVVLIVEIGAGGRIVDASVARSSGHRILDDAAMRAVRRLGMLGAGNAGRSFLLTIRFVP